MKSNSDSIPLTTVKSNGLTQVRYDAVEVTRENPDGSTKTSYDFSYVEIEGELTRSKIINAIIAEVHTKDAELALINNELATIKSMFESKDVELTPTNRELTGTKIEPYSDYQLLREHAKAIADVVLESI